MLATRMVTGLPRLTYARRLEAVSLPHFKVRRHHAGLFTVFIILTGKQHLPASLFFHHPSRAGLRGHASKLAVPRTTAHALPRLFDEFAFLLIKRWRTLKWYSRGRFGGIGYQSDLPTRTTPSLKQTS